MTLKSSRASYRSALRTFERARDLHRRLEETNWRDGRVERAFRNLVPPGVYEHWKSSENKPYLYVVYGIAPNVDDAVPPSVSYSALYMPRLCKFAGRLLLDEKDGFLSPIFRPDDQEHPYIGPRFRLLKHGDRGDLGTLERTVAALHPANLTSRTAMLKALGWGLGGLT